MIPVFVIVTITVNAAFTNANMIAVIRTIIDVITCHHERRSSAGFKLDTLLKLADVKGTDRKTSLLHFVLDQLLKESTAMHSLPHQLSNVKSAANLQASCSVNHAQDWILPDCFPTGYLHCQTVDRVCLVAS